MIKAANYDKSRNPRRIHELRLFFVLWSAPNVAILFPDCRNRMQKAFSLPRSCIQILRAGKKRLKEQKSTITKAATYAQKRELRFFCSLVCAGWGSPYFAGTVCQMFFAYSFTALSAANLPEQAVFIRDIEFQRFLSAQSSSILFCA